mgnify:CR=1 FL=1
MESSIIYMPLMAHSSPPLTSDDGILQTDLETVCQCYGLARMSGHDEWAESYDQIVEAMLETHGERARLFSW